MATNKKQVIEILNKDVVTFWDLRCLVNYLSDAFKASESDTGLNFFQSCSEAVVADIKNATDMVMNLSSTLVRLQKEIDANFQKAYEETEKLWEEKYKELHNRRERIERLSKSFAEVKVPEIVLPYNWKGMIEMTEQMANMTDKQKECLMQLVEAFKTK